MIMMGDFNAGEDNPAIQKIYQCRSDSKGSPGSSKCFVDSFRVLYPTTGQVGTFNAWKGIKDGQKIDYVFVSEHFRVRNAAIVDYNEDSRYPSDHFPVTATLELVSGSRSQKE
jgi:endonuclease/exonuclease/phosphatase family metal-dependent hydrolase